MQIGIAHMLQPRKQFLFTFTIYKFCDDKLRRFTRKICSLCCSNIFNFIPCSRAAWYTTFSYGSRVSVIAFADLFSCSTMNRDWAVASVRVS